ncbi:zinc-binding protein A33-like [Latimeria chalumnae]|uniref:zinc-binding protein A33-like n=1 Tax=Latimeria chalumnae TaxID=7897 RepID=UPI0006D90D4A|nr:PREDICTED: zinc-binding protein A33-like [Latimeria chalumnae]|eukprot:XP_006010888.2 PREDICTED: zinc-binding protein A33-like [Latimeria chalumnae]
MKNHKFRPIKEAASEYKEEVKTALTSLRDTQKKRIKVKEEHDKLLKHIMDQAKITETQIKEDFVKLHLFLYAEEWDLLVDLKKEEEEKEQKMREKIKSISEEITSLSNTIMDIKKMKDQEELSFLMNCQDLRKRAACTYEEPKIPSRVLIDVPKYLGNLQYRVWQKMLTIINAVAVTLDPNTAASSLAVSEDLTTVTFRFTNNILADIPERFDYCVSVLGSEGFTSGRHRWVVDVGNKTGWDLGVAKESINRKGEVILNPKYGYWTIALRDEEYYGCTKGWTELDLENSPKKILISLDYEAGEVSFFNADDMSCIYIFTDNFTEKLYPFFSPCNNNDGKNPEPLHICPL